MKTFQVESNIGEGLFTDDAVRIALEFPNGDRGEFEVYALTQDIFIELQKDGVKFSDYQGDEEAYDSSKKIITRLVKSGTWKDVEIDDSNKHKIVSNAGLTKAIMDACRFLAEERLEEDEGNSES